MTDDTSIAAEDNGSTDDLPFAAGDRIGSYVVESVLEHSAEGVVYRGRHAHMDRGAVLSVLTRPDWAKDWYRGANLLSGLTHPNIVKLYDIGEERGFPYLVLQYIEGESLNSLADREGTIEIRVLLRLMASIAGALQHAHENGVLHKTVTPGNIVIGRSGEPVLVEFARAAPAAGDSSCASGVLIGVPYYMSPEHWTDTCRPESDIWSFGVVLYTIISGRRPYDGSTPREVRDGVLSAEAVDMSPVAEHAPEYVVDIVERCLRKDPDERFRSADDLRHALEAALEYGEMEETGTFAAPLPADGQTILAHVEYQESGLPGAFRQYRVGEYLGGGSFGDVFRATDELSGRDIAMKVLKKEHLSNEEAVARFRREATLLSRLNHPNVVRVFNFGRYGSTFFVAMEMLGRRTLKEVIAEGAPVDTPQAIRIAASVLEGLAELHDAGIVHRDLKPSNLAVDGDRVVVFDLGIAHASDMVSLTVTGAFVGSARYAAPEQATARPVSGATDVYAVGVVLYELLTGHTPHEADSTMGMLRAIAGEPPRSVTEHRTDLPPQVVRLLDQMLAKRSDDRPTAREAIEALR